MHRHGSAHAAIHGAIWNQSHKETLPGQSSPPNSRNMCCSRSTSNTAPAPLPQQSGVCLPLLAPTSPLQQPDCRCWPPRRHHRSPIAAAGLHAATTAAQLPLLAPTPPLQQSNCRCGPLPSKCSPVAAEASPHTDPVHHPLRNFRCTTWLNSTTCSSQRQAVNMQYPRHKATVCSHVLSQLRTEYR